MHPQLSRSLARALAALAFLACALLAPAARAGGVLDQTSPFPMGSTSASFFTNTSAQTWQVQIQAGVAGQLTGITVTLVGSVGQSATFRVRKGAAPSVQSALFDQLVTQTAAADQALFVDMTASNITLAAGDLFVLEIQGTGGGLALGGSYIAPPGMPLYPQPVYLDGAIFSAGWRIGFMTYMASTCPAGTACDDGNACTQNDVCDGNGGCAGTPVVCTPFDTCHTAGACDPTSGACTTGPALANGTACDDGDACTRTDTCVAGVCTGASPIPCTAADACHVAGTCDPTTGICSAPVKVDGTACDDGNACTKTDTCVAGVCTGASPVSCSDPPPCLSAGACDKTTGTCSYTSEPDGTACTGGTCKAGNCVPTMTGTGGGGTGGGSTGSTGGSTGGTGGGGTGGASGGTGGSSEGMGGDSTGATGAPHTVSGCGCRMAEDPNGGAPLLVLLGLGVMAARRRRSRWATCAG